MNIDIILTQIVNGLMLGSVYVMVAVAFALVIGMLNFLNFTIPSLFMVSTMMMWATMSGGFGSAVDRTLNATVGAGNKWIVGVFMALIVTAVLSLVIERFTYRYMKAKYGDATEHALPLVSSLGFLIILEHLVIGKWGSDALTIQSPFGNASFHIGSVQFEVPRLVSLLLSLAIVFLLSLLLKKTRLGRALRGIAERPDTATLMGIDVGRIVPIVYIIAGALCAIAGVLFTISYTTIDAYIGDKVATVAIAGMVLGGLGNIWGAIWGGLFVGVLETLSIHFFGSSVEKVPIWGLLLVILIIKPTGLFGHTAIGKGKF